MESQLLQRVKEEADCFGEQVFSGRSEGREEKEGEEEEEGGLSYYCRDWLHMGFCHFRREQEDTAQLCFREWAPNAARVSLVGDFNCWNEYSLVGTKDSKGVWTVPLGQSKDIPHGSRFLLSVVLSDASSVYRIPAFASRVVWCGDDEGGGEAGARAGKPPVTAGGWVAVYWEPLDSITRCGGERVTAYPWRHACPPKPKFLRIYEVHVGICTQKKGISTFLEMKEQVVPWAKKMGYTAIQIIGIQEHPYYGSFGYQVSSMFAVSSRFGTPEHLMELIDEAHRCGLLVFLDLVHSHACSNVGEGLNLFDGTHLYFTGELHPQWTTSLFDYSKPRVVSFLLSNLTYWKDVFHLDGFRFDAVTSMIYTDHGLECYECPWRSIENINTGGVAYLMMANKLLHDQYPGSVTTIAEEVSGFPGTCVEYKRGGLGFDFRLAMGIPPMWEWLISGVGFEHGCWPVSKICKELTNRMARDPTVCYAECHDQSIVGSQPIAMQLMGDRAARVMNKTAPFSFEAERALGVHKMIRLATLAMGSSQGAFLDFIGNEFAHPGWLDFPRPGNDHSFDMCRRRWNLVQTPHLRYGQLATFTAAMFEMQEDSRCFYNADTDRVVLNDPCGVIAQQRGHTLWVFNFSETEASLAMDFGGDLEVVLNTSWPQFGGEGLGAEPRAGFVFPAKGASVSIAAWTALVLARKKGCTIKSELVSFS